MKVTSAKDDMRLELRDVAGNMLITIEEGRVRLGVSLTRDKVLSLHGRLGEWLEKTKAPEIRVGQVWRHRRSLEGPCVLIIAVDYEVDSVAVLGNSGKRALWDFEDFTVAYDFVSDDWQAKS